MRIRYVLYGAAILVMGLKACTISYPSEASAITKANQKDTGANKVVRTIDGAIDYYFAKVFIKQCAANGEASCKVASPWYLGWNLDRANELVDRLQEAGFHAVYEDCEVTASWEVE